MNQLHRPPFSSKILLGGGLAFTSLVVWAAAAERKSPAPEQQQSESVQPIPTHENEMGQEQNAPTAAPSVLVLAPQNVAVESSLTLKISGLKAEIFLSGAAPAMARVWVNCKKEISLESDLQPARISLARNLSDSPSSSLDECTARIELPQDFSWASLAIECAKGSCSFPKILPQ